jgi:hypothetical protein
MKKEKKVFLINTCFYNLILALILISANQLVAEEKDKLPQAGRLAGTTNAAFGGLGFEGSWGGENISGEDPPPIAGSVNRASVTEWLAKVSNNTPDKYQVSLRIEQLDSKGKKVKSDSLTVTLKPMQTMERVIRAHAVASHAEVNLVKWKKFDKELNRQELEAKINEKKAELAELEASLALAE